MTTKKTGAAGKLERENEELRKQLATIEEENQRLKDQMAGADTAERPMVSNRGAPLVIDPVTLVGMTRGKGIK